MNDFFDRENLAEQIREGIEKELRSFSSYWNPGRGSIGCAFLFLSTIMLCVALFILIQIRPSGGNNWVQEDGKKKFQISDIFLHLKTPDDSMNLVFTDATATQIAKDFLGNRIMEGDIRFSSMGIEGRFLFKKYFPMFLNIVVVPKLKNGGVDFHIVRVSVGKLPFPPKIADIFLKYVFRDTLKQWNIIIEQNLEIGSLEFFQGNLILKNVSLPHVFY